MSQLTKFILFLTVLSFRIAKPWSGQGHRRIAHQMADLVSYFAPWGMNFIIIVVKDFIVQRLYWTFVDHKHVVVDGNQAIVTSKYFS